MASFDFGFDLGYEVLAVPQSSFQIDDIQNINASDADSPNSICHRSGRKAKRDELVYETFTNLWVLPEYWEATHPQLFIGTHKDEPSVGALRPEHGDIFLSTNEVTVDDL